MAFLSHKGLISSRLRYLSGLFKMQGVEGFLQWNRQLGQEMQFPGTGIRRIATGGGRIRRVK